ncbi:TIM-barrel domain-containing protein [[Acholeplasma] multilocale]|uniref:TIM-barrel domain-containing protein n=1 Tax=[Acholeplasma] multilocale TaxID=264638 RepID=UPI000479330F|nr:TIM-barrel domain-containing protein [[Acholeplasma] multilocale]
MGRPGNLKSEMLKHSFPIKERIFDPAFNYAVASRISDIWTFENSLFIETTLSNLQKSTMEISVLENGIVHLKYTQKHWQKNRFEDHLNKGLSEVKLDYVVTDDKIELNLSNDEKMIFIKNPFRIKLLNSKGETKFATNNREGYMLFENYLNPPLGWKIEGDNDRKPFMSFNIENDEKLFGLGEKFRPLVKNGVESVIFNSDNSCVANNDLAYNGLPLLYSTNNWGILVNTGHKTTFEIGSPVTDAFSFKSEEECLDLYFFTAKDMKGMISQYTELTGRINGVPDEGYGIWLNRLYYHNREELFTEIRNAKKYGFPLDVITLDPKWLNERYVKSCNFEYNTKAFGDFKQLFKDVHDEGLDMCFWMNPYIQGDGGEAWEYLSSNELLVKSAKGGFAHPWTGTETYQENNFLVDFSNPKAYQWYKDQIKKLFELGLRYVKPDYGDGLPEDAVLFNGKDGEDFKQYYTYLYTKCAYEAGEEFFGPGQTVVLCRPGYIGTQKFVGKWSGDSASSFNELKNHMNAGLSLSLAGEVVWGTDITGFKPTDELTTDLYVRWTQFGMLTTLTRYHAMGKREPWYYGEDAIRNANKYAQLKKTLLPYYKMLELEAIRTGIAPLRPMVLENQEDSIAMKIDDQFYIGESLLVAPVLKEGARSRQVYLPEGEWYNFFDKSVKYQGKKLYTIECGLDEILMFVKDGSVIVQFEKGDYNFKNIDEQTLILNEYGNIKDIDIEFAINNKHQKIKYKDNKITIESNHKHKINN